MVGVFVAVGASAPPGKNGDIHSGSQGGGGTLSAMTGNDRDPFECGEGGNLGGGDLGHELHQGCYQRSVYFTPNYPTVTRGTFTSVSLSCFGTLTTTTTTSTTTTTTTTTTAGIVPRQAVPACATTTQVSTAVSTATTTATTTSGLTRLCVGTQTNSFTTTAVHTVTNTATVTLSVLRHRAAPLPCATLSQTNTINTTATVVRTLTFTSHTGQ